jgi:hypothetical protein
LPVGQAPAIHVDRSFLVYHVIGVPCSANTEAVTVWLLKKMNCWHPVMPQMIGD